MNVYTVYFDIVDVTTDVGMDAGAPLGTRVGEGSQSQLIMVGLFLPPHYNYYHHHCLLLLVLVNVMSSLIQ